MSLKPPYSHGHRHNESGSLVLGKRANLPYHDDALSVAGISKEKSRMKLRKTFKEVALEYLAEPTKQNRDKSATAYKCVNVFIDAWGDQAIEDIDDVTVADLFRELRTSTAKHRNKSGKVVELLKNGKPYRISNSTYNNYVTYYKAVFNYARDERHLIKYVPHVKLLKENRRTKYLTPDQVKELAELFRQQSWGKLRADLILFSFLCGQRHEQCVHLRIDQLTPDLCFMEFSADETKNGKPQRIPLNAPAQDIVRKHLAYGEHLKQKCAYLQKEGVDYVFVQEGHRKINGKPLSVFMNRHARKLMNENGFKGVVFHTMRHSFASALRASGTADRSIQSLGGWSSAASMQQYSHVAKPELLEASNNLAKLL